MIPDLDPNLVSISKKDHHFENAEMKDENVEQGLSIIMKLGKRSERQIS